MKERSDLPAEAESIGQLLEFYSFMAQANGLIARADDIGRLYNDICHLAIRLDRRLVLAWVGVVDASASEVRVVACAGSASGYLGGIRIVSISGDVHGQGPTGRALRSGRSAVSNRFLLDPTTVPWHDKARACGIAASIALPLFQNGDVCGVLTLYASEEDAFDARIAGELDVLAHTLSSAIEREAARAASRRLTGHIKETRLVLWAVLDAAHQAILMLTPEGEVIAVNRKGAERLGLRPQELVGRNVYPLLPPEVAERRRRVADEALRTGQATTLEDERNGRYFRSTFHPVREGPPRLVVYSEDITDQRRAEQAVRAVDRKFREVVDLASEGIVSLDREGRITFANPRLHEVLGAGPGALIGRSALTFVSANHREDFFARLQRVRTGSSISPVQVTYTLCRDSGEEFPALISVSLKNGDDGDPDGLVAVITDISELRRVENALRDALRVVEASPVVCFRWRAEPGWPVDFVSPNVSRWGWRVEDLCAGNPTFVDLVCPDDRARVLQEVECNTAAGIVEFLQEYRVRAADGHYFWVEDSTRVLRDASGKVLAYEGVVTDIDAEKRREEDLAASLEAQRTLNRKLESARSQLLQAEKMASIGQLAAGVAHEINNPIGFVSSNFSTLATYLHGLFAIIDAADKVAGSAVAGPDIDALRAARAACDFDFLQQDIQQLMAETKEGLERVCKTVQDLKDFSRTGEVFWQWANIHEGLDATLNIVRNEIKYHCTVTLHYGQLPPIYCLPSQLNQVFMNLLLNAGQAIEGRGEITVTTAMEGEHAVRISVADTGRGIPPEHLSRIFDPFFTTKPVGKGTGLGLSLAWGIIRRHGGHIEVESEVGKGSTFTITLPVKPAEAVPTETSA